MQDPVLLDPIRYTKRIWFRFFRSFFLYLEMNCWDHDLYQEFELAGLLAKNCKSLPEASKVVQTEFRQFLKAVGYSKKMGKFVVRDLLMPPEIWQFYYETGRLSE